MKRTQRKDAVRNIKKKFVSFLSILLIAGLGVGGFLSTNHLAGSFRANAREFYREANFRDGVLLSSQGITTDDIRSIAQTEGVADVEGGVEIGGILYAGNAATDVDILSLTGRLNRVRVLSGKLPAAADEVAVDSDLMAEQGLSVGDRIRLVTSDEMLDGALKNESFVITAEIRHPAYIRRGSGSYVVIDRTTAVDEDVARDLFTHAYIRYDLEGAELFTDDYGEKAAPIEARLSDLGKSLGIARDEENLKNANRQLADAEKDADQQLSDAAAQIADAEQQIADAKEDGLNKIREGERELRDKLAAALAEIAAGEKTLAEELAKAEQQIRDGEADAERQLADAEKQLADAERDYAAGEKKLADGEKQYAAALVEYDEKIADAEQQLADAEYQIDVAQSQVNAGINTLNQTIDDRVAEVGQNVDTANGIVHTVENALTTGLDSIAVLIASAEDAASNAETALSLMSLMLQYVVTPEDIRDAASSAAADVAQALATSQTVYSYAVSISAVLNNLGAGDLGQDELEAEAAQLVSSLSALADRLSAIAAEADVAKIAVYQAQLVTLTQNVRTRANNVKTRAANLRANVESLSGTVHNSADAIDDSITDGWNSVTNTFMTKSGTAKASAASDLIKTVLNAYTSSVPAAVRNLKPLADLEAKLRSAADELDSAVTKLNSAQDQIDAGVAELNAARATYEAEKESAEKQLADAAQELEDGRRELEEGRRKIEQGKLDLEAGRAEAAAKLAEARAAFEEAKADGERKLAEARAAYEKGKRDGERQLAEGRETYDSEIAKAEDELAQGKADYESGKAEADEKLADAREQIASIPKCNWYLQGASMNEGPRVITLNIQNAKNIGLWVSSLFLLIGVLVCFSTVTILISDQTKLVGSMKANGFYNREILAKYLLFSLVAALIGAAIAAAVSFLLGKIMLARYRDMFLFDTEHLSVSPLSIVIAFILTLLVAALATVIACRKLLRSPASALMSGNLDGSKRRKSAKTTESGGSLYSRLILRNMASEPARIAISIVIIAASCIVIGVGISLNAAFQGMISDQLDNVLLYDVSVKSNEGFTADELERIERIASENGAETARIATSQNLIVTEKGDTLTNVIAASDPLTGFFGLREAEGQPEMALPARGMLVDERLEEYYGIASKGSATLLDGSLNEYEPEVAGTFLNYQNNYVVMSDGYYREVFGTEAVLNEVLIRLNGADAETVKQSLAAVSSGLSVESDDAFIDQYKTMIFLFKFVVYMLVGIAVLMTFMVLTNLVNIFVNGKKRELIIMRVNGFSQKQGTGYLLKETVLTTLIGLALGLALGIPFANLAVANIGSENYTLVPRFHPAAWIVAIAVEALFAVIINAIAFRKVTKLDLRDITKV